MLNRLLVAILIGAQWMLCADGFAQQQPTSAAKTGETTVAKQVSSDKSNPLLLQADDLVYDNKNNRVVARGNVEIYYNDYTLLANEVIYDKGVNTLTAIGNVRMKEPDGSLINAERLTLRDDFKDGFIRSLKAVTEDEARIAAATAYRKDGQTTVYQNGVFTACKPCEAHPERPPIWRVKAKTITMDKADQRIYYEDSTFELYGVPIAYIPYFYMPDPSVKRLSGFLMPQYSASSQLGYTVATPYYYSISPQKDLTVTPEFTTGAGFLMQLEYRQKIWDGAYKINLAGAYNYNSDNFVNDRKFRGSAQTTGDFALGSLWHFGWNATLESDDTFRRFYRLDDIYATERVSQVYLTGIGDRNYFNMSVYRFGNLTGKVFDFETQTFSKAITATAYPVIDYNYIHNKPVLGGELSFNANAVALTINDPNGVVDPANTNKVFRRDTDHISTEAQWRRTLVDGAGQVYTPFFQARGDVYHVSSFHDADGVSGSDDTFTRDMLAGGLEYRYPFVAHTDNASHVIEPVGQIIARTSGNSGNDKIPNEDAQSLVFDDTLLFDINKFSGYDRIETGTRANVGVQYTMQTYNGVSVRMVGGESIQVAGRNPFDPTTGLATDFSDYVAGGYVDWKNMFRLTSQVRFKETDFTVARQDYRVSTKLGFFQGAVSYVSAEPTIGLPNRREEVAGFVAFRLNDTWTIFGDSRYDMQLGQFIRDSAGVLYSDDCFTMSVTYAQTFIQYQDIKPDTSVLLKIGLKYLGQQTVSDSIGDLSPEAAVFK